MDVEKNLPRTKKNIILQEKLLLSALLAKNIGIAENEMTEDEWSFLFCNRKCIECTMDKPDWIAEQCWWNIER